MTRWIAPFVFWFCGGNVFVLGEALWSRLWTLCHLVWIIRVPALCWGCTGKLHLRLLFSTQGIRHFETLGNDFMTCFLCVKSHVKYSVFWMELCFSSIATYCMFWVKYNGTYTVRGHCFWKKKTQEKKLQAACHVSVTWNLFCKSYIICICGTGL